MKWIATIDGAERPLDPQSILDGASVVEVEPGVYSVLTAKGASIEMRVNPTPGAAGSWNVSASGRTQTVSLRDPRERAAKGSGAGAAGRQNINAPMPGKVVRVLVQAGDTVEAGQGVIVVEAMKMQNEMKSPKAGTVAEVRVDAGATVAVGETLLIIE
ncbi:acetyl-CoA carboxylase biotin carboxyl carrier protein subunit [Bryobacterales bacterium F-183]|nr:acetyl-CoA carboxylase biotin carboxyl carrier protein subunit [Bryobacterales bacterium F-183]